MAELALSGLNVRQLAIKPAVMGFNVTETEITARQAGDRGNLLEFGGGKWFELHYSFKMFAFCERHKLVSIPDVEELTPGVCTLHITYERVISPEHMLRRITDHWKLCSHITVAPSRTRRLPFAFDDQVCRQAVDRYAATIRDEASWLPSNIAFLEKLNGIETILETLLAAQFLVIGLGDVFMGSACAIPLDPRHRLSELSITLLAHSHHEAMLVLADNTCAFMLRILREGINLWGERPTSGMMASLLLGSEALMTIIINHGCPASSIESNSIQ